MKYTFGDLTFSSKEKAFDYFKAHFQSIYDDKKALSDGDKGILKQLLEKRDDFDDEYLSKITDFRLVENPKNKSAMETQFLFEGNWIAFSLNRCIVGYGKTQNAKNNKSLREMIEPQIQEFRSQNEHRVCKLCLSTSSIQVDHYLPTFHNIVQNYYTFHGLTKDTILTESQMTDFVEYHKKTCNLRYLCANCNLQTYIKGKGRKQLYSKEDAISLNRERARERKRLLRPSPSPSAPALQVSALAPQVSP
jgi:hypothetical protein